MRILAVAVLLAACGGGSRPEGQQGGLCRADGTCDPGLVCDDGRCVGLDGGMGPIRDGIAFPDAATMTCANDSALEPNDSPQMAFPTGVATQQNAVTFAGLAICPPGDQDFYRVDLVTLGTLKVAIAFEPLDDLALAIENADGSTRAVGMTSAVQELTATAVDLQPGSYFVHVSAANGFGFNNYRMSISVTP